MLFPLNDHWRIRRNSFRWPGGAEHYLGSAGLSPIVLFLMGRSLLPDGAESWAGGHHRE